MIPGTPQQNMSNGGSSDSVLLRYLRMSQLARGMDSANLYNLCCGKPCARCPLTAIACWLSVSTATAAACATSFCYTVGAIISDGTKEKVCAVLTTRYIASMTNKQYAGIASVLKMIRYSTGNVIHTVSRKCRGDIRTPFAATPQPAFLGSATGDLRPKAGDLFWGKSRNWFILKRHADYTSHVISVIRAAMSMQLLSRLAPFYSTLGIRSRAEAV